MSSRYSLLKEDAAGQAVRDQHYGGVPPKPPCSRGSKLPCYLHARVSVAVCGLMQLGAVHITGGGSSAGSGSKIPTWLGQTARTRTG